MDMGSRRMQIVGIVLAVLMAALLAVTLWVYRPVSLAEAADARTGQRYFHCTPTSYTSPQMAAVSSERGSDWVERSA